MTSITHMTRPAAKPPNEAIRVRDIELRFHGGRQRPPMSTDDVVYVHKDAAFVASINGTLECVRPKRMVEVGLLDGGSTVYWHYQYDLERLAAFDIAADAPHLTRYIERNKLAEAIRVHFGVAQTDRERLRTAIAADFGDDLVDAVVDDASHEYAATKACFETIFPYLRTGGAYVIEDWAWGHSHKWPPAERADMPLMSPLLSELMLVCGHASSVIDKVEINRRFAVIWRGAADLPKDRFRLSEHYTARGFAIAL
jgi:SAM-dependent methyltransferase